MPYYMGDYGGDPGFCSLVRRGVSSLARRIPGILARVRPAASASGAGVATTGIVKSIPGDIGRIMKAHPTVTAAAGAAAIGILAGHRGPGKPTMHAPGHMMIPGGMHRRRRMRVTNPKALRRALRRAHGFAKLAMRTIHLVYPRKKAHFGGFKMKRRAKV